MKMKRLYFALCMMLTVTSVCPEDFVHPWKGKKVAYFGDSITDPNVKTKGEDDQGKTNMDILGNAYEYLNGQFAATAGKKAGEYHSTVFR